VLKTVVIYGIASGLLVALLRFVDYRFIVVEHSVQIYGLIIAGLFVTLGIRLGRTLTREKVVVKEVEVPAPVNFTLNQARVDELEITPRELEVLQLMADGLSNKEMAEKLFVSENTIKTHCSRVFDKLGAERRTQAVQRGKSLGLIA
jgi:DNA-binding CsgD family transcriptional regulator